MCKYFHSQSNRVNILYCLLLVVYNDNIYKMLYVRVR